MCPTHCVTFAQLWREIAMGQAHPGPTTSWCQMDFHYGCTATNLVTRLFETPRKYHLRVGYNFQIFSLNYVAPIGIQPVNASRFCFHLGRHSHPAQHLDWVCQELENHLGRRLDADFFAKRIGAHRLRASSSAAVFKRANRCSQNESKKARNSPNPSCRTRYNLLVPCRR